MDRRHGLTAGPVRLKNPRRKEGAARHGAVAVFDMIYFLEDDNSIRELVVYTMNSTGFDAVGFSKPREFWAAMEQELPSLILLDIMLPEEDGLQILKKLRADKKR